MQGALYAFGLRGMGPGDVPWLSTYSAVWLMSLVHTAHTFDSPHYRAKSFGIDIRANTCNVAVPGTGLPLSLLLRSRLLAWLLLLVVYPAVALATALFQRVCMCARLDG